MAGKLSFSIAINLLTENFRKGTNHVKSSLRSIQAQALTFAAAMGFAGVSLSNFVSQLIRVARETSRAVTALKNVSGSTAQFTESLRFTTKLAQKYGVEVNGLTGNFAKFTAAASIAGMSIADQRKLFESLSRAAAGFALSADDTNGMFLAVTQMMSKGKIQAEELRGQLGERLPIAMQAMAKAAGTSAAGLDEIMKKGKLLSANVLPGFADALNEMLPNVDTDNPETSLNRLKNVFQKFTKNTGIQDAYKSLIDGLTKFVTYATDKMSTLVTFVISLLTGRMLAGVLKHFSDQFKLLNGSVTAYERAEAQKTAATERRVKAAKILEATQRDYETTVNGQRLASEVQLEKAKSALKTAEARERKAILAAQTAAEEAAAMKSMGIWKKTWAVMVSSAKRAVVALKALGSTIWVMALITAISALITKIIDVRNEAKRIKNIFSDYKKESLSIGRPEEADKLQRLYKIASNIKENENVRKAALAEINNLLGTSYSINQKSLQINGDINTKVAERIKLLKDAAAVDFYQRRKLEAENGQKDILARYGGSIEGFQKAITASKNRVTLKGGGYNYDSYKEVNADLKTFNQLGRIAGDADKQLSFLEKNILTNSTNLDPEGSKDLQKAEESYAKALSKLKNQLDNRTIIEKEYDKELKKLNKDTYKTLSGLLTPDEAAKNKTFQAAKASKPDSKIFDQETAYWEELNKLSFQYANNYITEKEYVKAKLDLTKATLKEIAGIEDIGEAGKAFVDTLTGFADTLKIAEHETTYQEKLDKLSSQYADQLIPGQEYVKAKLDLTESMLKEISGMKNIGEAGEKFVKALTESADSLRKELFKIPAYKERDKTFDYKKTDIEKLQAERDSKREYADAIKSKIGGDTSDLEEKIKAAKGNLEALKAEYGKDAAQFIEALNEALGNVTSLEDALKIAEVKKDIQDLTKEFNRGMYASVKDIASGADRIVSAFSNLKDVFSDEDATAWERIMAVWNAMTSTVDAFMSIIQTIETLTKISEKLAAAKQKEADIDTQATAQKVTNAGIEATADMTAASTSIVAEETKSAVKKKTAGENVAASTAEGAAAAGASAASLPFPWNLIAIGGAIAAAMAAFAVIPKFAGGGIIQGSPSGDRNLARVNGGEMILNGSQQATLFQLVNGKGIKTNSAGEVEFKIKYDTLVGVLKKGDFNKRRGR